MTEFRVRARAGRITIIGINGVTRGATRRAIVARLFVGAEKPKMRIVQTCLGDVDNRHSDTLTGARPAIGLLDIRTTGFVQFL